MLLEVQDLNVSYGDIVAVRGISFSVAEGEFVSVVGANGAGKSSTLGAVMGLIPATGRILLDGRDVTRLGAHQRSRLGIRIVPERARLFPQLSVRENLLTGLYGLRKVVDVKERLRRMEALFPILGERRRQAASTLSGGEQQMLSIARALIAAPRLLLVDEVSMGLAPKLVDNVFALLSRLHREEGLAVLLVEQNALASLSISHRAYVLETGSIVLSGDAKELLRDPRIREAYLGA